MYRKKIALIIIILLAAFLRLWRLDSYPALNADEAAIGYNAYSLIETGRDEHGNPWPIHFQSFNDYKPGLYFYLVLPFVKFLGLNEWSVRLPGAILGVATVFVVYLLVLELGILGRLGKNHRTPASLAALMLAISPWHIHFSRGGWEVNVATFFITCGVWLFLKAIRKPKLFVISFSFFVLSLFTYHAARIVVPLLVLGLFVIYREEIKRNLRVFTVGVLFGVILFIPLGLDLTKGSVFSRAAGVGLFSDPGPIERINEQRGEHGNLTNPFSVILHNKPINYTLSFLENWGEHFSGEFLFLTGDDIQRNKVPETGQMYITDLLFVLIGLASLLSSKFKNKQSLSFQAQSSKLILWWLVVAPVAAALTFQSPHSLRANNMVIPLVIISAYGLVTILGWLKKQKRYFMVIGHWSLVILIAWQFSRYLHIYYKHMAKEYSFSSQYGVKELVSYIKEEGHKYEKIVVTDAYDQPYILFLFYLRYPPEKFQGGPASPYASQGGHSLTLRDQFGFSTVESFDNYQFQKILFDQDKISYPGSLIIGTDEDIPDEANVVKEIYGTNGYKYFVIVGN